MQILLGPSVVGWMARSGRVVIYNIRAHHQCIEKPGCCLWPTKATGYRQWSPVHFHWVWWVCTAEWYQTHFYGTISPILQWCSRMFCTDLQTGHESRGKIGIVCTARVTKLPFVLPEHTSGHHWTHSGRIISEENTTHSVWFVETKCGNLGACTASKPKGRSWSPCTRSWIWGWHSNTS